MSNVRIHFILSIKFGSDFTETNKKTAQVFHFSNKTTSPNNSIKNFN